MLSVFLEDSIMHLFLMTDRMICESFRLTNSLFRIPNERNYYYKGYKEIVDFLRRVVPRDILCDLLTLAQM